MPDTFKIGTTLLGMAELPTLFSETGFVFNPDWSYQPFAGSIKLADGTLKGIGFPVVKWRFNHLSNAERQALKALISTNLSGTVYIHTPTNEVSGGALVWDDFIGVMEWTPEDEDKAADETLGLVLTFTHLVAA